MVSQYGKSPRKSILAARVYAQLPDGEKTASFCRCRDQSKRAQSVAFITEIFIADTLDSLTKARL
jgi:hypothetical protein